MNWTWGNRCGHNREEPRLRLVFEPRWRPPAMVRKLLCLCERLFYRRGALLARLGICARSERAEAIVLVLKALLLAWDQVTSRVGWARGGGYLAGVPVATIARWANLDVGRAQRAICALMHAGLLQGTQAREELPDGRWVALPKVRRINWTLFFLLGVSRNELEQAAAGAQEARAAKLGAQVAKRPAAHREGEPAEVGELLDGAAARWKVRLERIRDRETKTGPPDG